MLTQSTTTIRLLAIPMTAQGFNRPGSFRANTQQTRQWIGKRRQQSNERIVGSPSRLSANSTCRPSWCRWRVPNITQKSHLPLSVTGSRSKFPTKNAAKTPFVEKWPVRRYNSFILISLWRNAADF